MTVIAASPDDAGSATATILKQILRSNASSEQNPVIEGCEFVYQHQDLVQVDDEGVKAAAQYIRRKMASESYSPRTWRTHPLHICPDDTRPLHDPANVRVLDWIFLISSLNFSFWSEREGSPARYGVQWQESWGSTEPRVYTGYWSLVASLNRALCEGIHITGPQFYASEELCPDTLIAHIFRRAPQSEEDIPLLAERIQIMRENGKILCERFGSSFGGFIDAFHTRHERRGTALNLVKMVTETFPSFRDEAVFEGRKVCIWKRAQILVAELWAAFYPDAAPGPQGSPHLPSSHLSHVPYSPSSQTHPSPPSSQPRPSQLPSQTHPSPPSPSHTPTPTPTPAPPHPLFPHAPAIAALTMFADYRVPQILHHLRILRYAPGLAARLAARAALPAGGRAEVALRAGSVVGVERVRGAMGKMWRAGREGGAEGWEGSAEGGEGSAEGGEGSAEGQGEAEVSSVLIDFYLWDLAKRVESGEEAVEGIETAEVLPAHRTRSIWY
ncbi:hypothetical protein HDZ31DRAFT_81702 [Schizophyllum fasciatum]